MTRVQGLGLGFRVEGHMKGCRQKCENGRTKENIVSLVDSIKDLK